ncbi:MAG: AAA family ATPase [Candidatus Aenigmatarchaeota archaeon]
MIIAICGTPGTGKTVVAKKLAEDLSYDYLSLTDFVKENKIGEYDAKTKVTEVDAKELRESVWRLGLKNAVVDGMMAYAIKNDACVVLRCNPKELLNRLAKKKWLKPKIDENVRAEILDIIPVKAMEQNNDVYEVDTSGKKPKDVVTLIGHIIAKRDKRYLAGKVDWTKDYERFLIGSD